MPLISIHSGQRDNNGQIRLLVLAANPRATDELRLGTEVRTIKERLREAQVRGRFHVESEWAVRERELPRLLLDYEPHLIHFCGHGTRGGEIVLEDDNGDPRAVPPKQLAGLFRILRDQIPIQGIILNACWSRPQAQLLVAQGGIPWVIGMKQPLADMAAIAFAGGFYRGLAFRRSIQIAFELGVHELAGAFPEEEDTPELLPAAATNPQETYLSLKLTSERPAHEVWPESVVPPQLTTSEIQELAKLIAQELPADQIRTLGRASLPPTWSVPGGTTAEAQCARMIELLADAPQQPDGRVPLLTFVEQLAAHIREPYQQGWLLAWGRNIARMRGAEPPMLYPPPASDRVRVRDRTSSLFLLIKLEPELPEQKQKRVLVEAWCERNPEDIRPLNSGNGSYTLKELPTVLNKLLKEMEDDLARPGAKLSIEVFLPYTLLDLAIEEWKLDFGGGVPWPVGIRYPVMVRSLERARAKLLWEAWQEQWCQLPLHENPREDAHVHWVCEETEANEKKLFDRLSGANAFCLVLTITASRLARRNYKQVIFATAVQLGMPVALWLRRVGSFSGEQRDILERLLRSTPLADLPTRVKEARKKAWMEKEDEETLLGRNVTLLWDDPTRPPPEESFNGRYQPPGEKQ